ncbi:MAG: alpha/beta hydrolase-fold protein [Pseudohongiella sp.]|nr:alpha/beta hydrolase-fold protein [Pseudohongiella sp.]
MFIQLKTCAHHLLRAVALLCALNLLVTSAQAQPAPASLPPLPDGLQTVSFFSPAVGRQMKFDIVLPVDYDGSQKQYPVLYLLHGFMQNYTVWGRNLGAAFYAHELGDLIVVMPDGGNSWFVNWAESTGGQLNNWEDHIVTDLVAYVDTNFRTEARREGRAIAGLSMGGYGALTLGLRHPDMFVSIASTSGALAHARNRAEDIAAGKPMPVPRSTSESEELARADEFISAIVDIPGFSRQDDRNPAGIDFKTVEQAQAYDPFQIIFNVPKNQLPHIYLDSGMEDGLITTALEFMQILLINDVPFEFMQARGRHNSEYWRRSAGHFMSIQYEVMQRALGNRP